MYILAYDIGGTKIEATVFKAEGIDSKDSIACMLPNNNRYLAQKGRHRKPTERILGYNQVIEKLVELGRLACQDWGIEFSELNSIGIALPGTVNPKTKRMTIGNALIFKDRPIEVDLIEAMGGVKARIYLDNDANLFALAETICGVGASFSQEIGASVQDLIGVGFILGTGVGAGVVIDGKPFRGRTGGAAELGHLTLHSGGHPCYCGRDGCVETYLSGPALEAQMSARRYQQIPEDCSAQTIFELAAGGEPFAAGIVQRYKRDLAAFCGMTIGAYDPDFIVLGGGVSKANVIYEGLSELASKQCLIQRKVPVLKNELGDSAGIIGAALLPLIDEQVRKVGDLTDWKVW